MRFALPCLTTLVLVAGCGRSGDVAQEPVGTHVHEDGSTHADHAETPEPAEAAGGHAHDEVSIGTVTIDGMAVEAAQGHGLVEPGKLCHLVIKLPYNDAGATIVRAWIGTEDRHLSLVGIGDYAASHDDYDVHAEAPDPLPADARWWIEIEKPDGTKSVGSLPILAG